MGVLQRAKCIEELGGLVDSLLGALAVEGVAADWRAQEFEAAVRARAEAGGGAAGSPRCRGRRRGPPRTSPAPCSGEAPRLPALPPASGGGAPRRAFRPPGCRRRGPGRPRPRGRARGGLSRRRAAVLRRRAVAPGGPLAARRIPSGSCAGRARAERGPVAPGGPGRKSGQLLVHRVQEGLAVEGVEGFAQVQLDKHFLPAASEARETLSRHVDRGLAAVGRATPTCKGARRSRAASET